MPIDPSVAIGADLGSAEFSWSASDVMLYHLTLGAGRDPLSPRELRYATERELFVLPTFATVAQNFHATDAPTVSFPGVEIDLAKVVHGSQSITAHRPLPPSGSAVARTRISDVFDKGKAAVIWQETEVSTPDGAPLWTARSSIFARGEGGFGGERGPSDRVTVPDREPDYAVDVPTLGQQALLYRLCGDRNPLHSDPGFAAGAGFAKPILHGLCTYGIVAKAVTDTVLGGDADAVGSWSAKFAGIMLPGETLRIRIWSEGARYLVTAEAVERSAPVLADAVFTAR